MGYVETKICNGCKVEKTFNCFSIVKPGRGDRNNLASQCKVCRSQKNLQWHRNNRPKAALNRRKYYEENKEKEIYLAREWRTSNRERHLENNKRWKKQNPSVNARRQSMRNAQKAMATPPWLNAIHLAQIQEMYDIAYARSVQTGTQHHVDHIFPIKGGNFSGLNVPWNMQVITMIENVSKKNRFPKEHTNLAWGGI